MSTLLIVTIVTMTYAYEYLRYMLCIEWGSFGQSRLGVGVHDVH